MSKGEEIELKAISAMWQQYGGCGRIWQAVMKS
jgi:hypothetical protein